MVKIGNSWDDILSHEWSQSYYKSLRERLKDEYRRYTIYPDMHDIFNAFRYTAYEKVKVVILGQDPYHEPGQAHGLSFSVKPGVAIPPSLANMFTELVNDEGCYYPNNGCLTKWAEQGVLLLNATLTVRKSMANAHQDIGWRQFTDNVISYLNERSDPMVFLLWGKNARLKADTITNPVHMKLEAPHPSPLSAHRGFFGCKHFSKANAFLKKNGMEAIDWQIENI